jgi:dihydroorotase
MKILIQNGRVIDPASGRDERADVAIAAGRIVTIGQVSPDFKPSRTIDASGLVVAPGPTTSRRLWWVRRCAWPMGC